MGGSHDRLEGPRAPKSAVDLGSLELDTAVTHFGDVVGNDAGQPFVLYLFEVADGQLLRVIDPVVEERRNHLFRLFMFRFERFAGVERVVEISLLLQALRLNLRRDKREPRRMTPNIGETFGP